jgi:hypothetical protein
LFTDQPFFQLKRPAWQSNGLDIVVTTTAAEVVNVVEVVVAVVVAVVESVTTLLPAASMLALHTSSTEQALQTGQSSTTCVCDFLQAALCPSLCPHHLWRMR